MTMKAWTIYLCGKLINTVFFEPDITANEVYLTLVNSNGYSSGIEVYVE